MTDTTQHPEPDDGTQDATVEATPADTADTPDAPEAPDAPRPAAIPSGHFLANG